MSCTTSTYCDNLEEMYEHFEQELKNKNYFTFWMAVQIPYMMGYRTILRTMNQLGYLPTAEDTAAERAK